MSRTLRRVLGLLAAVGVGLGSQARTAAQAPDGRGQVDRPSSLGRLIADSDAIAVLEVERVEKGMGVIRYKAAALLKGTAPAGVVCHEVGECEPDVLRWAEPGKKAVCFTSDGRAVVCLGNHWYFAWNAGENLEPPTWTCEEWSEQPLTTFVGPVDRLSEAVSAILAGQEVVITAQVPGEETLDMQHPRPVRRDWRYGQKGRVWRIKAGTKIEQQPRSELSPHFVGWGVGGEEVVPCLLAGLGDRSGCARAEVAEDLGQLGPLARAGVPALRRSLDDPDFHVRLAAAAALARIDPQHRQAREPLLAALRDGDADCRKAAAMSLADLGPWSAPAVPALLTVLHDTDADARAAAGFALGRIVPEAQDHEARAAEVAAALGGVLRRDKDKGVRFWVVHALLRFGPEARPAKGALADALRVDGPVIADPAADALVRLGRPGMPALVDALKDPECRARARIAEYMGEMGPAAGVALPALRAALRDEDPGLRLAASAALLQVDRGGSVRDAVPVLGQLLRPESQCPARQRVFHVLEELGPDARAAVPDLALVLRDEKRYFRELALRALARIGPGAAPASPALWELCQNEKGLARVLVAGTLGRVSRGRDGAGTLLAALASEDEAQRAVAARALGEIGPDARWALPALRSALRKQQGYGRTVIALALWNIERPVEGSGLVLDRRQEAITILLGMLRDGSVDDRAEAAEALACIGPEALRAVPLLCRALEDEESSLRWHAAIALGAIGSVPPEGVAALRTALRRAQEGGRLAPAVALCPAGHPDAEVVSVLLDVFEHDPDCGEEAAQALATLGSDARAAVPALLRALRRGDHAVYLRAARALRRIDPDAATRAGVP